MHVYHRTHHAEAILREGFRDGYKTIGALGEFRGIFVSAPWPLDENEGADGDVVLELDVPAALFVEYEHVEEGLTYREAMIPAAELNRCSVRVLSEAVVDALTEQRWEQWERDLEESCAATLRDTRATVRDSLSGSQRVSAGKRPTGRRGRKR